MSVKLIRQVNGAGITKLIGTDGRAYYPPRSRSVVVQLRARVLCSIVGAQISCRNLWANVPSSLGLSWGGK